jgi:hypothetical protein
MTAFQEESHLTLLRRRRRRCRAQRVVSLQKEKALSYSMEPQGSGFPSSNVVSASKEDSATAEVAAADSGRRLTRQRRPQSNSRARVTRVAFRHTTKGRLLLP